MTKARTAPAPPTRGEAAQDPAVSGQAAPDPAPQGEAPRAAADSRPVYPYEPTGQVTHQLRELAGEMMFPCGEDRDALQREVDRLVRSRLQRILDDLDAVEELIPLLDLGNERHGAYFLKPELEHDLDQFVPGDTVVIEGFAEGGRRVDRTCPTFAQEDLARFVDGGLYEQAWDILDEQMDRLDRAQGDRDGYQEFLPEEQLAYLLSALPLPALEALQRGRTEWAARLEPRRQRLAEMLEALRGLEGPTLDATPDQVSPDPGATSKEDV